MLTKNIFRKIFAATIIGHSTAVEFNNRFGKRDVEFSANSADDIVMDHIATGDILMFNRKWYYYHFPTALMIQLHKVIYGQDVPDHSAVVICDELGNPFVYERTPFSGYKLRPYEQRILHSKAKSVILIPLSPRLEQTRIQKNQSRAKISDELTFGDWRDSEILRFIPCAYTYLRAQYGAQSYSCGNAEFVLNTLNKIGVTPIGKNLTNIEKVTISQFMDQSITLEGSVYKYTDKDVENYNKLVKPVKQKTANDDANKTNGSGQPLSMIKKRNIYTEPMLKSSGDIPLVIPCGETKVKLSISEHIMIRTR